MAKHIEKGKLGEEIALEYLIKSGFEILQTNFRHGRTEIDIIYMDYDTMVFVEIKTRSSNAHGAPEVAISPKKIKLISSAASAFMTQKNHNWKIRFDVISIVATNGDQFDLHHFKDAFFW
jgi:putative endonuclease